MTTLIIILTITAACLMFIWLAIKAFNAPKVQEQITDRRKSWFDFRLKRWQSFRSRFKSKNSKNGK